MAKVLKNGGKMESRIGGQEGRQDAMDLLLAQDVLLDDAPKAEKKKPPVYVTLNELEKMNVKQFNRNVRADFKPYDFLIESDEDDAGVAKKPKKGERKNKAKEHS
jgi:hypothetical protein